MADLDPAEMMLSARGDRWALGQSSTGDLGIYGAPQQAFQPTSVTYAANAGASGENAVAPGSSASAPVYSQQYMVGNDAELQIAAPSLMPMASTSATTITVHQSATALVDSQPVAMTSGMTSAQIDYAFGPGSTGRADMTAATEIQSRAGEAGQTAVNDLQASVAALQESIAGRADTAAQAVSAQAADLIARIDALTAQTQTDISAIVGASNALVADTINGLREGVDAQIAGTIGTLSTVAPEIGSLTGTLDDLVLGGADPAAGVTTLVSMVSAADVFQLNDAGSAIAMLGEAPGVIGMADLLSDFGVTDMIGDLPSDILLGVGEDQGGLIGGLLDDDGHGLGLG